MKTDLNPALRMCAPGIAFLNSDLIWRATCGQRPVTINFTIPVSGCISLLHTWKAGAQAKAKLEDERAQKQPASG
jgi:hypothetical protein